MKKLILFLFFFSVLNSFSQENKFSDWHSDEVEYYNTLKGLVQYIHNKDKDRISKDTLFKKYIYFDNILKDTVQERKHGRIAIFEDLFSHIPRTVDSIGILNLDAKPLRFYKNHKIYRPFQKVLKDDEPYVMVYYRKDSPDEPLGTLLFEPESHKLWSWILLKQGSGWFYLTLVFF